MRIVLSSFWYPVGVASYLLRAARRRLGLEVLTVGPGSGGAIPWGAEFAFPQYGVLPDIPFGDIPQPDRRVFTDHREMVREVERRGGCDLWIDVEGFWFVDAPVPWPRAWVATDPHIGDITPSCRYEAGRALADFFFCMQSPYCKTTPQARASQGHQTRALVDHWLPYAYDPCFYPEAVTQEADVSVLGAGYPKRRAVAEELARRGFRVLTYPTGFGTMYDEHRRDFCAAPVAFLWSVRDDLICRVFEAAACGRAIVANEVPNLGEFLPSGSCATYQVDWEAASHGYEAPRKDVCAAADAVEALFTKSGRTWVRREPLVSTLQQRAFAAIQGETWDARLDTILSICLPTTTGGGA